MTRETVNVDIDTPADVKAVRDNFETALIECLSESSEMSIEDFGPVTVDVEITVSGKDDDEPRGNR